MLVSRNLRITNVFENPSHHIFVIININIAILSIFLFYIITFLKKLLIYLVFIIIFITIIITIIFSGFSLLFDV